MTLHPMINRREALQVLGAAALGLLAQSAAAENKGRRRMSMNLMPGMIGVSGSQVEIIDLAHRHGFESVEPQPQFLGELNENQRARLLASMKERQVTFGAASLPVDFRNDEAKFEEGLSRLSGWADGLQRAGVTRMGTWLSPGSNSLTYVQNFKQHAARLRKIAEVLEKRGLRFGLEYVGTKTLRDRYKHPFVHNMAQAAELIEEIGTGNVGFVLDSWHWWQAGDTANDILSLKNEDVIAVDLNDAPAGIPKEQQLDGQRELPMATGVIDIKPFLASLQQIGYDGPVRAEPFNKPLNELDNEAACAKTSQALRTAFQLLEG